MGWEKIERLEQRVCWSRVSEDAFEEVERYGEWIRAGEVGGMRKRFSGATILLLVD